MATMANGFAKAVGESLVPVFGGKVLWECSVWQLHFVLERALQWLQSWVNGYGHGRQLVWGH